MSSSNTQIPFLDVLVKIQDGALKTDIFTKPTDAHAYLHRRSSHPKHILRNIPYSQFLRLRRICSDPSDFDRNAHKMSEDFRRRGYDHSAIEEARKRATDTPRQQTLAYRKKHNTNRVPFVITYHPSNPPLRSWLRELQPTLHSSGRMKSALPETPIIGERCRESLRSLLMPSILPQPTEMEPGCRPCQRRCCIICKQHLTASKTFTSATTGKQYHIRNAITCDTPRVIYLLCCNVCQQSQYVGETSGPLRQRFYIHRSDINIDKGSLVTKHFNSPGHTLQNMRVTAIERIYSLKREDRLRREGHWIKTLKTLTPFGLNALE